MSHPRERPPSISTEAREPRFSFVIDQAAAVALRGGNGEIFRASGRGAGSSNLLESAPKVCLSLETAWGSNTHEAYPVRPALVPYSIQFYCSQIRHFPASRVIPSACLPPSSLREGRTPYSRAADHVRHIQIGESRLSHTPCKTCSTIIM